MECIGAKNQGEIPGCFKSFEKGSDGPSEDSHPQPLWQERKTHTPSLGHHGD